MLAGAGCGGAGDHPAGSEARTRLETGLASVAATEPLGVGFGWVDVERLRARPGPLGAQLEWAAGALGPGGREIADRARAVGRSGIEPLKADSLTSTATSYTLAVRLDGVDSKRAEAAFAASGARRSRTRGWTNFDLGREWSIPGDRTLAPLGSLAARTGVKPEAVLLARSSLARRAMERAGPPATEADEVGAAADCLGDVLAARFVLNNHTHLPNSGPELLAFGVSAGPADQAREVLCVAGGADRVDPAAESLGDAFAGGARDAVTGERMRSLVTAAEVDSYEAGELAVANVRITRAPETEPGFLFGAFDRGSTLTYLGLQPPPSPGD